MVAINSQMLGLGTEAPPFHLPSATGGSVSIEDFRDAKAFLVMFICNHCPFVKHVRDELVRLANDYRPRGVAVVAINSNDWSTYPDDSPEMMEKEVQQYGYPFAYLYDETQEVAKAYQAACTPDFFLFDADRKLVYRGQLDDSRPGNQVPVSGKDLRAALEALLGGKAVSNQQRPSLGCNVKWRPGNEPDYFKSLG
jgi:peroxiredoxin